MEKSKHQPGSALHCPASSELSPALAPQTAPSYSAMASTRTFPQAPALSICPNWVSTVLISTDQHLLGGGRHLFHLTTPRSQSLREVKAVTQNRNKEAGTDAETIEEHCAAYWVAQLAFLYNSGPPAQEWSGLSYVNR